jgi:hypothetical protein
LRNGVFFCPCIKSPDASPSRISPDASPSHFKPRHAPIFANPDTLPRHEEKVDYRAKQPEITETRLSLMILIQIKYINTPIVPKWKQPDITKKIKTLSEYTQTAKIKKSCKKQEKNSKKFW